MKARKCSESILSDFCGYTGNHRMAWDGRDFKRHLVSTTCCGLVVPHQLRLTRALSGDGATTATTASLGSSVRASLL